MQMRQPGYHNSSVWICVTCPATMGLSCLFPVVLFVFAVHILTEACCKAAQPFSCLTFPVPSPALCECGETEQGGELLMDLSEMQTLTVCCLVLLQSPVVPIKSLVSWCCCALPLMMSAMLSPPLGGL